MVGDIGGGDCEGEEQEEEEGGRKVLAGEGVTQRRKVE